jgi:large subunit ribosomal protein L19
MIKIEQLENEEFLRQKLSVAWDSFERGCLMQITIYVSGSKQRFQTITGICIGKRSRSLNSSFRIRTISSSQEVEYLIPYNDNVVHNINIIHSNRAHGSKLYFLKSVASRQFMVRFK